MRHRPAVASALLAEDLLAQDVCMPAAPSKLTQDVKAHPAQRERTAPVAAVLHQAEQCGSGSNQRIARLFLG